MKHTDAKIRNDTETWQSKMDLYAELIIIISLTPLKIFVSWLLLAFKIGFAFFKECAYAFFEIFGTKGFTKLFNFHFKSV